MKKWKAKTCHFDETEGREKKGKINEMRDQISKVCTKKENKNKTKKHRLLEKID